jgi:hypothetical protein
MEGKPMTAERYAARPAASLGQRSVSSVSRCPGCLFGWWIRWVARSPAVGASPIHHSQDDDDRDHDDGHDDDEKKQQQSHPRVLLTPTVLMRFP